MCNRQSTQAKHTWLHVSWSLVLGLTLNVLSIERLMHGLNHGWGDLIDCMYADAAAIAHAQAACPYPSLPCYADVGHDEDATKGGMGRPIERMLRMAQAMLDVVNDLTMLDGTKVKIRVGKMLDARHGY